MKWPLILVGAAVAAAGALLVCKLRKGRKISSETDDIDGGVVKRYWADAPKVIESTEIVEFRCEISLIAACETEGLGHRVYKLDAVLKDGEVLVRYDWYERQGGRDKAEYRADISFMARLQEIAVAHNFAQHNGYYHTVSGLPDMYGETLHILYASGERIDVHDNQSGFLPLEAEKELITLFGAATKSENN